MRRLPAARSVAEAPVRAQVFIIEKYGRRNLMLYTAALMSLTMAALTATTHPNVTRPRLADPNDPLSIEATNKAPGYAAAV